MLVCFFLFCFQIISVITDLTFQYDWLALLNKLLNSITGVFFMMQYGTCITCRNNVSLILINVFM